MQPFRVHVSRERGAKLRPVENQIAVLWRQYRRHRRVRRWIFDERGYRLTLVRREGSDIDQSSDLWIVAGLGDHGSAVGVADKNYRTALRGKNALGCGDVVGQRCRRILDDTDGIAVFPEDLVNGLPARTVHKATVNENNARCRRTCQFSHDYLLF